MGYTHRGPDATPGYLADVAELAGLATLRELADVLGVGHGTVRIWNLRGIPSWARRQLDQLLRQTDAGNEVRS